MTVVFGARGPFQSGLQQLQRRNLQRVAFQVSLDVHAREAFGFMGLRCDRVVAGVFAQIASPNTGPQIH